MVKVNPRQGKALQSMSHSKVPMVKTLQCVTNIKLKVTQCRSVSPKLFECLLLVKCNHRLWSSRLVVEAHRQQKRLEWCDRLAKTTAAEEEHLTADMAAMCPNNNPSDNA